MIHSQSGILNSKTARSYRKYTGWLLACILLSAGPAAAQNTASEAQLDAQRAVYTQALKALRKGQTKRYKTLVQKLGDYPLKPYLEYRYLVVRRSGSHDQDIAAFIAEHKNSHLGRRLRDAWLPSLFKRRQYSKLITVYEQQNYGDEPKENIILKCLYVRSHIRLRKPAEPLTPLIHSIWLHGKSRPKICDPLLKWFRTRGLNDDLVWQRIQLTMQQRNTRLARYLKRFLKKRDRALVDLWIRVHSRPHRHLKDKRLLSGGPRTRMIAEHGVLRLARKRPNDAQRWLEKFHKGNALTPDQVQRLRYRVAMSAASDGLPQAHALMTDIPQYQRDPAFKHMRLRLALHNRNWHQVLQAARELPQVYPFDQMGLYWQARALKTLGRDADSKKLYQKLAKMRGYYGFLSAERLKLPHSLNNAPVPLADTAPPLADAALRAREFYAHNSIMNARMEWNDLLEHETPQMLNQAAVAASRWGWHEGAIRGFGKSRYFDDLRRRFPLPYSREFEKNAKRNGVNPAFLYAIARRESAFAADTRSRAGAVGLMQLMPATARQVARSLRLKRPRTQTLKQPNLNIRLGSRYLASMLKRYGGNVAMALASYNAGPGAVGRWRPGIKTDADIWIDTIPYEETRRYVRTVLEYAVIYQWQRGQKTDPIWPQIHPIRPAS